jgi:hypothetical protein
MTLVLRLVLLKGQFFVWLVMTDIGIAVCANIAAVAATPAPINPEATARDACFFRICRTFFCS